MGLETQPNFKDYFQFIVKSDRNCIKVSLHSPHTIYLKAGEMHSKEEQSHQQLVGK